MRVPEGYFTVTEVARRLGVHPITIGRWELHGKAPQPKRLKRTGQRLYTEEDVKRLEDLAHGINCGEDKVIS